MSSRSGPAASLALRPKRKRDEDEDSMGENDSAEIMQPPVPQPQSARAAELAAELADLGDESREEAALATQSAEATEAYLPKKSAMATKKKEVDLICKTWTPGWAEHFDPSIRPEKFSKTLLHHLVVMSTVMNLADANERLRQRMGRTGEKFGPVDVRKVCEEATMRDWPDIRNDALVREDRLPGGRRQG